jgi:Chromo (CHRromatin Organisation MOdifier) domain
MSGGPSGSEDCQVGWPEWYGTFPLKGVVSEILDSKIDKQCKCQLLYLVQWTGYKGTDQETDWLPAMELEHAPELVQDFSQVISGQTRSSYYTQLNSE